MSRPTQKRNARRAPGAFAEAEQQSSPQDTTSAGKRYAARLILRDGEVVTHSVHRDRRSAERVVNSLRWAGRAARVDELEDAQ